MIDTKDWMNKSISIATNNGNQYRGTIKEISISNGKEVIIKIGSVKKLLAGVWKSTYPRKINVDECGIGYDRNMVFLRNGKQQTAVISL